MRTTLKRGVGRGTALNGNGDAVYPPETISLVTRYEQPPPPRRSGFVLLRRILLGTLLVVLSLSLAVAGAAYLWFHQSVTAIRAHSVDVKVAQRQLDVTLPGQAAVALVVGYDKRKGQEATDVSRSDTVMLLRADPDTKTISMLSFPRDLIVDVYCPGSSPVRDRINTAYARCGSKGTLETVKKLTGLPINYLITVDFHGFKQIVDELGGVWLDIDRRYYNKNVGTAATDFADINLKPGYQRLSGENALAFVRYRHTDSDLYRLARQQEFVRALKQQVAQHWSVGALLRVVNTITHNVEVGAKSHFDGKTVLQYALLAATLPGGHFLQTHIENVTGFTELSAPTSSIHAAVTDFVNPDVDVAKVANASALGRKVKPKAPPPNKTTVTVLNGNGVPGAAANASYQLGQKGYVLKLPPAGAAPNAPIQTYFHTQLYFHRGHPQAKAAARGLQKLLQPADVRPLPRDRKLRSLDPGSMVLVVLGQTFHDSVAQTPEVVAPKRQPAYVRYDPAPALELLRPYEHRVPFPLQMPTILERSSIPDTYGGDKPARLYWITKGKKAVRLVFRTSANEYWGIQETNWPDAPVLDDKSFRHALKGREFDLYYSGPHLHMVVLRSGPASYWVVNTLRDSLSNETMLAIAKGLKRLNASKQ
jgi:LCP family protein required for cell wall assembly